MPPPYPYVSRLTLGSGRDALLHVRRRALRPPPGVLRRLRRLRRRVTAVRGGGVHRLAGAVGGSVQRITDLGAAGRRTDCRLS